MAVEDPVVIVGAGLMGAAAAWSLSRRNVPVVVVEQFPIGHSFGGSHGSARIVRRAYVDDLYVHLTGRAFELWDELEDTSKATLIHPYGAIDFGDERDVPTVSRLLADAKVEHEVLTAREAEDRWPGMRFAGDIVYHSQAGTLDADAAIATMLSLASAAGAVIREQTPVTHLEPEAVLLADGSRIAARCVVVAAGGWVGPLLAETVALPPITVTRQSVFHFPRRDHTQPPWPSVIHHNAATAAYHLAGGRNGGQHDDRKVGLHNPGQVVAAGGSTAEVDAAVRERVVEYVTQWLPGLDPVPRGETTCLYTSTPTEDFLLDRVGDLVVCSPCSGHGAKFAPLIGELTADLVSGSAESVPERFRLLAHLNGRAASVSL